MKIQKSILTFIILFITCITTVKAEVISSDEMESIVVARTDKYYKTVTILDNSQIMTAADMGEISSITTEISKEEFDNAPTTKEEVSPRSITIDTNYKRLTSTITKESAAYFIYKAELYWKTIPKTRSNDVMAIGYYGSVRAVSDTPVFTQRICWSDGECMNDYFYYSHRGSNGVGVAFGLPSGDVTYLKQTLEFSVEKNTTSTIVEQLCVADYAHAQRAISFENSQDFWIDTLGINHTYDSYYDTTPEATAVWTGKW